MIPGRFTIPGGNPPIVAVTVPRSPGFAGVPVMTVGPVLVIPVLARIEKFASVPKGGA